MTQPASAGAQFRAAVAAECPLQVVGAINAYAALLAEHSGFRPCTFPAAASRPAPAAFPT
jgi:2-methylisocitrate lyase-like PEP mutase family enzyme